MNSKFSLTIYSSLGLFNRKQTNWSRTSSLKPFTLPSSTTSYNGLLSVPQQIFFRGLFLTVSAVNAKVFSWKQKKAKYLPSVTTAWDTKGRVTSASFQNPAKQRNNTSYTGLNSHRHRCDLTTYPHLLGFFNKQACDPEVRLLTFYFGSHCSFIEFTGLKEDTETLSRLIKFLTLHRSRPNTFPSKDWGAADCRTEVWALLHKKICFCIINSHGSKALKGFKGKVLNNALE